MNAMGLQIPSFLHGAYKDVSRACTRKVRALARGATFAEIVESWVDVDEAPGLLILEGPSNVDGHTPHFHCFALSHAAVRLWSSGRSPELDALRARWLDFSLSSPWSFLGLLGQDGLILALSDARLLDFLERAGAYWPELHGVGARYSYRLLGAEPLERIHTSMMFALARQGVPAARSMGPDGPAPLLADSPGRRVHDFLVRGKVEQAASELRRIEAEVFLVREIQTPTDDHARTNAAIVLCALGAHFVAAGHGEVAAAIIREIAQRADPHGLLFNWLSEYAATHADTASKEDVVRAYLERGGSPNWERLVQFGPQDAAKRVVEEQQRRADWNGLMMTLIHHTHDFDAALSVWDERVAVEPRIRWAAEQLADGIASRLPERAVELYVLAAEEHLPLGKRYIYRRSASLIAKGLAVLRAAGMEDRGRELVEQFRQKHRNRRLLLEAIAEQGL